MKNISLLMLCLLFFACSDNSSTKTSGGETDQGPSERLQDFGVTDIFVVDTTPTDGGMSDAAVGSTPSVCIEPPTISDVPVRLESNCRTGNQPKRIQDYRNYRCEDYFRFGASDNGRSENTLTVTFDEVVVTGVFDTDFAVQDVGGGAFSGLWVYTDRRELPFPLEPGMRVRITGQLMEYYGLTELRLDSDQDALQMVGRVDVAPEPIFVTDPSLIADDGYLAKELESLLVTVPAQFVLSTSPDCPFDYDMFVIGGGLRIEDEVGLTYEPSRGDFVDRVTGIVHFSFSHQKVLPRNDQDLLVTPCGGVPDKCDVSECIFEIGAVETGEVRITEIQDDPRGADGPREYVELYNGTSESVSLTGWKLQNCTDTSVMLNGVIPAGGYYVLAGSQNPDENGGIVADQELGDLNLPNGNGSLLLLNGDNELVDQVRYQDEEPWPIREDGESLEVLTLTGDNSNGAVWRAGTTEYGQGGWGTPGESNR